MYSNLIGEQRIQMQAKDEITQAIKCAGEHASTHKARERERERERERYFETALTKNERLRSRHPGSAVSALWVSYILDTYIKKRSENNN